MAEEKKQEKKKEEKQQDKEHKEEKKPEKEEEKENKQAIVQALDLPISLRHSIFICNHIRGKNPEKMIKELELVTKLKKPIKMSGEIPHRKNIGTGRYPAKAAGYFIKVLKNLIANANVKKMNVDKLIIEIAKANKGARMRRGTRIAFGSKKFKRTHLFLSAVER